MMGDEAGETGRVRSYRGLNVILRRLTFWVRQWEVFEGK